MKVGSGYIHLTCKMRYYNGFHFICSVFISGAPFTEIVQTKTSEAPLTHTKRPKPLVLIILDGFGHTEKSDHNAIALADTPVWDRLWNQSPHTLLRCAGDVVGLPDRQMGNSEVGHLHLGCGRLIPQDLVRINKAIEDGSFFSNPALCDAVERAQKNGKALHIMGLLSPGGVHSHERHLEAMAELAVKQGLDRVYLHAFLDGRDTPPKSAGDSLRRAQAKFESLGAGRIASLTGRFYAMDRDQRWERIQAAYDLLTLGKAEYTAPDALTGLEAAYDRGETDEFVQPTAIVPPGSEAVTIEDGDVVVFMNFRADRARQITRALTERNFDGFERERIPRLGGFVALTEYQQDFDVPVAFLPIETKNSLGEVLSRQGLTQLRLAETEKYAHVTFFFNGGTEEAFPGEERVLIPSPKVRTYDEQPEMSVYEVTDVLVEAIEQQKYDVIICNFANGDMVGHTGVEAAAVQAVEAMDQCLGRVAQALDKVGAEMLVTADHGNCEQMVDPKTGQPHTAHTLNPVPLVYYRGDYGELDPVGGSLADVAPTMLALLGIEPPAEMNGHSLAIKKV